MTTPERIEIKREELFTDAVDRALARERTHRPGGPPPEPVSPLRAVLNDSLFYLPLAAALAAFVAWLLTEPYVSDWPRVRGEVVLVNGSPFDAPEGVVAITVGNKEVFLIPGVVEFLPGTAGQPAISSVADDLVVGRGVEVVGLTDEVRNDNRIVAHALRPSDEPPEVEDGRDNFAGVMFFVATAALIALALLLAEGLSTRNWSRMVSRSLLGGLLAVIMSVVAMIPAGLVINVSQKIIDGVAATSLKGVVTVADLGTLEFLAFAACRSLAWAMLGAALGLGMNLVRSTRAQLRNSVLGGALGGALGGLFFDPLDRFIQSSPFTGAETNRMVGVLAVGVAVGVFMAIVERLAREAWLKVLTGPLAGKSFVLYRTPTRLGSSPDADIYLYKDAEIDGEHAVIHRVGMVYELEDAGSRTGTKLGGQPVRRRRLVSGDQIVLGGTVLVFEERAKGGASWQKQPAV